MKSKFICAYIYIYIYNVCARARICVCVIGLYWDSFFLFKYQNDIESEYVFQMPSK